MIMGDKRGRASSATAGGAPSAPTAQRPGCAAGPAFVSEQTVGLLAGLGLGLWAFRRVSGLDLLLGFAGAALVYRALGGDEVVRSRRATGRAADREKAGTTPRETAEAAALAACSPDPVDEASDESFPGSDPPAFTGSTATRAVCP